MKRINVQRVLYTAAGLGLVSLIPQAKGQIAVDGSLDTAYGAPLAVQTNNTGFGDSTVGDGTSNGGSELDAAYGNISNGTLYLFLAGNLESNYNHLNIFIADGRTSGQSTLNTNGTLGAANGSLFSPGFAATYAIDINGGGAPFTEYVNTSDLTQSPGTTTYLGSFSPNTGTATSLSNSLGALSFAFNNSNAAGVVGGQSAANSSSAAAVTSGLEVAIPLTELGSPHGNIEVLADITGGNDNYPSNQFLPGLPTIEPNLGSGSSTYSLASNSNGFNFGSVANQFFTVQAPVTTSVNSVWLATGNGSWAGASNWSSGVPNAPAAIANFNSTNTAAAVVTLDGSKTVGQIQFNSANSYNISQGTGGVLTINDTGDTAGVNPLITVNAGSHTISAPVNLSNGLTVTTTIGGTALNISGPLSGSGAITKTGAGNFILSGSNSFAGGISVLNGAVEFDTSTADAGGTVTLGDETADSVFASFNIGRAGLTVSNPVVTNYDDSEFDNQRAIAAIYPSGTSTFSGTVTLNGGIVLSAPVGSTLIMSGTIQNGTESNGTKPKYDLTVNGQSGTNGGVVLLTVPETYTGQTNLNGGTLSLAPAARLATSAIYVNSGAVLNFAAQNSSGIFTRTVTYALNIETGGTVTVAPATSHANRQLLVATNLSIAGSVGGWTGQLDIANNDVDIQNSNIVTVNDQVRQGFNAGGAAWAGEGIVSSTAAVDTTHATAVGAIPNTVDGSTPLYGSGTALGLFDGYNPSASDVLVKYTYFGDTNLDGKVDGTDYSRIDNGFLSQLSPTPLTGWYNGDFNYDGVIDGSDYTLIDNAFNTQGSRLTSVIASPLAVATSQLAAGTSAVPEPAMLSLLGIGAASLLGRRRRNL